MTAGEDEPQTIVLNFLIVKRSLVATRFKVGDQMALHSIKPRAPANPVDGFEACGGDQPGSRIVGDARLRPGLQSCSERLVHRFFSQIQVPGEAHQVARTRPDSDCKEFRWLGELVRAGTAASTPS
jgi:hypothetical protein